MIEVPLINERGFALIDDDDLIIVQSHRWRLIIIRWQRYARCIKCGVYMHKLLTGWVLTDHEDHNGLNNQRENLRSASIAQNGMNRLADRGQWSSKFKGVSWNNTSKKWRAQIQADGVRRAIGEFADLAATSLHGEFACTNEMLGLFGE